MDSHESIAPVVKTTVAGGHGSCTGSAAAARQSSHLRFHMNHTVTAAQRSAARTSALADFMDPTYVEPAALV